MNKIRVMHCFHVKKPLGAPLLIDIPHANANLTPFLLQHQDVIQHFNRDTPSNSSPSPICSKHLLSRPQSKHPARRPPSPHNPRTSTNHDPPRRGTRPCCRRNTQGEYIASSAHRVCIVAGHCRSRSWQRREMDRCHAFGISGSILELAC